MASLCLSDRTCRGGKGAARPPAAGFSRFKQHMQIKLAGVPLHLPSSSAVLPNNSQAKLTQFEMKIRFIFRGIYFPLASVSMEAFSVWPDKHPSTLSPDPLSPSDSHLTGKRPRGVELVHIQMAKASPSPHATEGGLCTPGPLFSTCLPIFRLASGFLDLKKP